MSTRDTRKLSANSNYYLELYTNVVSQNADNKTSRVYYRMRVYKTYGYGYWATTNNGSSGSVKSSEGPQWSDSNLAYDFANGSMTGYQTFDSGYLTVNHGSDGIANYWVEARIDLYALGSATVSTGTRSLPDLANVPPAPTGIDLDRITQSSMRYQFTGNGNGGSKILEWQVGYGKEGDSRESYVSTPDGLVTIHLNHHATRYYFWSRGRNAVGWGEWSNRLAANTLPYPPPAPTPLRLDTITQTSMFYQFEGNGNGGSEVLEWQIGYGTNSSSPQQYWVSGGRSTVTGLNPSTTYYFWSRGRNSAGWGRWSARRSAKTLAGTWIKINGVWKPAVPYVNVDGVWKVAEPYVKTLGVWSKTG